MFTLDDYRQAAEHAEQRVRVLRWVLSVSPFPPGYRGPRLDPWPWELDEALAERDRAVRLWRIRFAEAVRMDVLPHRAAADLPPEPPAPDVIHNTHTPPTRAAAAALVVGVLGVLAFTTTAAAAVAPVVAPVVAQVVAVAPTHVTPTPRPGALTACVGWCPAHPANVAANERIRRWTTIPPSALWAATP